MGVISIPYFLKLKLNNNNNNLSIRWTTSDVNVFYHTFVEKEFFTPFKIDNVNFIIDAGANIGMTAILLQNLYPLASIVAIEPEINNFKYLKRNTLIYPTIKIIQKGLWHSDTYLRISNPSDESWAFKTEEVSKENKYDIEAISIDTIMSEYEISIIDILKIDIEGAEKDLF